MFLLRLKDLGCKKVSSESLKAKRVEFFFRKRWRERKKAVKNCAASAPGKNALWHYWASDGLAQESCDVEALTAERKKNLQPTIEGPPKTGQPISDRLETSKSYQTYLVAPHSSISRKNLDLESIFEIRGCRRISMISIFNHFWLTSKLSSW